MFLLAIGVVISTSDRYKRQNKPSKLATNLKRALMARKLQLPSAAIRFQFLSSFSAGKIKNFSWVPRLGGFSQSGSQLILAVAIISFLF